MSTKKNDANGTPETARPAATGPVVKFDDTGIINAYANVCNVSSSREEIVLVFGMNNAWERETSEVRVKLNSRVTHSPFAAKRLALLLNSVVQQYEARFGVMDMGVAQAERTPAK